MMSMSSHDDKAFLVIPDAPVGLDMGLDGISFEVGPKFLGVSDIPIGLHFLHHSIGIGSRQGFFFYVRNRRDVIIRSWSKVLEEVEPFNSANDVTLTNLRGSILRGDLNENLGSYPIEQYSSWKNLTSLIDSVVLAHANCTADVCILPGEEEGVDYKEDRDHYTKPSFVDILSTENKVNEEVNSTRDLCGDRAARLTAINMDKSEMLEALINLDFDGNWEYLLGELQLSFLLLMLLYSYSALQQWKKLLDTLCRSERYLLQHQLFACAFLRIFYEQLHFSPSDFFTAELSRDNFLAPALSALFSSLDDPISNPNADSGLRSGEASTELPRMSATLKEHRARLFRFVQKKFGIYSNNNDDSHPSLSVDKFNLVLEDEPVFVSREEIASQSIGGVGSSVDLGSSFSSYGTHSGGMETEANTIHTFSTSFLGNTDNAPSNNSRDLSLRSYPSYPTPPADTELLNERWKEIDRRLEAAVPSIPLSSHVATTPDLSNGMAPYTATTTVTTEVFMRGATGERGDRVDEEYSRKAAGFTVSSYSEEMTPSTSSCLLPPVVAVVEVDEFLPASSAQAFADAAELEAAKYSWRYPLLYDEMMRSPPKSREDMVMAAARVLEMDGPPQLPQQQFRRGEEEQDGNVARINDDDEVASVLDPEQWRLLRKEALMFIESEIGRG